MFWKAAASLVTREGAGDDLGLRGRGMWDGGAPEAPLSASALSGNRRCSLSPTVASSQGLEG